MPAAVPPAYAALPTIAVTTQRLASHTAAKIINYDSYSCRLFDQTYHLEALTMHHPSGRLV